MSEPRLRQAPDACQEILGDEIVVYLPGPRTLHRLDANAVQVWALFAEPLASDQAIDELVSVFPESATEVRRDVTRLVADMIDRGLLVDDRPAESPAGVATREDLLQIT